MKTQNVILCGYLYERSYRFNSNKYTLCICKRLTCQLERYLDVQNQGAKIWQVKAIYALANFFPLHVYSKTNTILLLVLYNPLPCQTLSSSTPPHKTEFSRVYCFHVVHPSAHLSIFPSIGNVLFIAKYLKKLKVKFIKFCIIFLFKA